MDKIVISSTQEAAFNAAGEAMLDIGLDGLSLNVSRDFIGDGPYFSVCAIVGGKDDDWRQAVARGASTPAEALLKFANAGNELIADPPAKVLREAKDAKAAALELVDEYRETADGKTVFKPLLDELAGKIEALPVKP
jgi:hypothetical protein